MHAPTQGRLIAVVGPSGVGKDSVMCALLDRCPSLGRVRRSVTREAGAGGEDINSLTTAQFTAARVRGDFALHWAAHGLHYGVPESVRVPLDAGQDMLVNLSRGVLAEASREFPSLVVLSLTARIDVLARRLALRGRESRPEIAARLERCVPVEAVGARLLQIDNSGLLEESVSAVTALLYPSGVPGIGGLKKDENGSDLT